MSGSIYDWSTVPGNNGNSDPGIDWTEGMAPSAVNNSSRQEMARAAELLGDIGGSLSAGGTANGITVTANSSFTTYAEPRILAFKAGSDNTGATTLNVNSIGTKAIRKFDSTGEVALSGGEIQSGGIYVVQYSSSANSGAGAWLLVNPTAGVSITTTDNAIARFDGTSGTLQNSGVIIDDSNVVTSSGYFHGASGGSGEAFRVGNDASLFDVNTAGTMNLSAVGFTTSGFMTFGSASTAFVGTGGAAEVIIGHDAGQITFRVNGRANSTNQAVLSNAGNLSATSFSGDGSSLTNVTAVSATTAGTASNSDLLDGQHGAFYQNATNLNAGTLPNARLGDSIDINARGTFGNIHIDGNGEANGHRLSVTTINAAIGGIFSLADVDSGARTHITFAADGTKGSIQTSSNGTSYNTSSDYRLKAYEEALIEAGSFIDALKPIHFTWKNSGLRSAGFFAHEFAEVSPSSVSGEKDAVDDHGNPIYQQMQASSPEVMAHIVAELQSIRRRLVDLEGGQ